MSRKQVFLGTTKTKDKKLRGKHVHADLCNIYQGEIGVLSKQTDAIQLESQELKLYYNALISAEWKGQEVMLLEIEDLKNELQSQEGLKNHEMSEERVACSFTVEEFLQELEEVKRKHLAEKQILSHELTTLRVQKEK